MRRILCLVTIFLSFVFNTAFIDSFELSDKGVFQVIVLMFLGGFLTAFTPCVYPLIPVTIGIISEINRNYNKSPLLMSTIYGSGIIITYTSLGVIAGLSSLTFGSYMGNPIFIWFIAILFFLLGLSMTGFYELKLPYFITSRITNIKGSGILSVFTMGLLAGFLAAPCTGPILASALIYIGTGHSPILGGVYLFFYALGLSIIFIITGTFSGVLKRLPKSGKWMVTIRSLFAVAIISYSIYLIGTIYDFFDYITPILSVFLTLLGISIGGLTSEADFKPIKVKIIKLTGILLISIGIIGLIGISQKREDKIKWITDYNMGMHTATSLKKPVIIDFYANWCAACKDIKKKTFPDERIQRESERFVMIFIDATNPDEKIFEIEKIYRVSGLPTIIFLDSNQKEIEKLRVTGFVNSEEFLRRMKEVR